MNYIIYGNVIMVGLATIAFCLDFYLCWGQPVTWLLYIRRLGFGLSYGSAMFIWISQILDYRAIVKEQDRIFKEIEEWTNSKRGGGR